MDVYKLMGAIIVLAHAICDVSSDCVLSIDKDFGNPGPVFLRNGGYLRLDYDGAISLRRSETVQVACPGRGRRVVLANVSTSYDYLEAHCIVNSTFRVDRWIGQFREIRCNSQPWFTTEETTDHCHNNGRIHKVGYKIKGTLHTLYTACFDWNQLQTHYVQHSITPAAKYMQTGLRRPNFIEGDLFGKVKMSALYKIANQKKRVDSLLGRNMSDHYITKKQSLTRGHLVARADYSLSAATRATFHYVNTAPQWHRGNAGDWAALEEALRRRVHSLGHSVEVVTGTHGVMTLPDEGGNPREIYLTSDENNNGIVPVPMYFYKLVYDPVRATATAFVSINSSYYNSSAVQALSFCADQCSRAAWLRWRNDDTHSFCCDYQQFIATVHYLPPINVTGLFY